MKKFNTKKEFEILVKNGWLNNKEADEYLNDEEIISAINLSTSPKKENIFNALKMVPFSSVKVVIIGQDPYPNPNHAHGLAFSSKAQTIPDSLKNIFIALDSVYKSSLLKNSKSDLTNWAQQGVLLLNTGLTFQKDDNKENQIALQKKHLKIWKNFIKNIIKKILTNENPIVMLLWGSKAHDIVFSCIKDKNFKKQKHNTNPQIIPETNIMLLQSSHPSPIAVNTGGDFLRIAPLHFKECDKHLGKNKINWTIL